MYRLFLTLIVLLFSPVAVFITAQESNQSVGLVLSGGGAKGIAHIGVIKALEDNDIPIDYITGTSMGSIVGGLYAAGYTPEEMMQLLLSKPFSYWSTGRIDPALSYFFSSETPTPVMLSVPIAPKDSTEKASAVPASLISPLPMNFAFMDLFSAYTAQCGADFDHLFVPFRCVASDVAARHKLVIRGGSLGDAIRASMSFPIVFQPIKVNGALLYDGGVYDNFPVDVMRQDFAPSIMIGIDVSTPSKGPQTSLMDQLENLIIQNNDYNLPADEGIKIHIDLNRFGLLDFPKAREIYNIGYEHAMQMMDSIKTRVKARTPKASRELARSVFKSKTPFVRFDKVNVTGGTPRQNRYIQYIFDPHPADTFGIRQARAAYYRAITPGKLRDLFPQAVYNDSTGLFDLNLRASVKNNFKVGFGGYITSSTNSYIFINAGYSTMSFNSLSADVNAWIGQSYFAGMINGSMTLRTPIPTALQFQAVASREKYYESEYLFYQDKMPTFILNHEYFARLKYAMAAGTLGKAEVGVGYGHLFDSFYRSNNEINYVIGRDRCSFNLGQVYTRYLSNTLNNITRPSSGAYYEVAAMGLLGNFNQHPGNETDPYDHSRLSWLQLEMRSRNFFSLSKHWSFGVESDIMLSTRKLLKNYNASIVNAPSYRPTPATYNSFNPAFRANSFIAAGVTPIYKFNDNLSARLALHGFLPVRKILETSDGTDKAYYGRWFSNPQFFGEFDLTYSFPFASLSAYCNYYSYPRNNWNVGISFGIFILAPKFLQ